MDQIRSSNCIVPPANHSLTSSYWHHSQKEHKALLAWLHIPAKQRVLWTSRNVHCIAMTTVWHITWQTSNFRRRRAMGERAYSLTCFLVGISIFVGRWKGRVGYKRGLCFRFSVPYFTKYVCYALNSMFVTFCRFVYRFKYFFSLFSNFLKPVPG